MWFMNHIWNPIVRLILQSPLYGMMDKTILLLTYVGQKSGKTITLPVQYVQEGRKVYVMPGAPKLKKWWHNIHENTPVKVFLRGQNYQASASLLTPENNLLDIASILGMFFNKFNEAARMQKLQRNSDGNYKAEDLARIAKGVIVVRIDLPAE